MFLSLVLSPANLADGLDIVRNNKIPVTESLAHHFFGFPSEESLRRRRPAQHAELVVPLDHGERRVLNVEGETPVLVRRCCFSKFAFGHVANDRNTTDYFTVFAVTWRVVTVEETVATGLWNDVRAILSHHAVTG